MYEYRLDLNASQILKLLRQVMQYSRECVILGLRVCFRGIFSKKEITWSRISPPQHYWHFVQCRTYSSLSVLYPLDNSSTSLQLSQLRMSSNTDGPWVTMVWLTSFWLFSGAKVILETIFQILNFDLFRVDNMQYDSLLGHWAVTGRGVHDHKDKHPIHSQPLCTCGSHAVFHFQYSAQEVTWDIQHLIIK